MRAIFSRLKLSFYSRVLITFIVTIVILITFTLWSMHNRISQQFEQEAMQKLTTSHQLFNMLESMRRRNLKLRSNVMVNTPRFFAAAQTGEPNTIRRQFHEFIEEVDCDILMYRSADGRVVESLSRDAVLEAGTWEDFGSVAVECAMRGDEVLGMDRLRDRIYRLAAMPVYVQNEVIGALVVAEKFSESSAWEFHNVTGCRLALFVEDKPVLLTLESSGGGLVVDPAVNTALVEIRSADRTVQRGMVRGDHVLALSDAFENPCRAPLSYMLILSYEQTLQSLRDVQMRLLGAGLIGILLSSGILGLVIGRMTTPLRAFRRSAEAVGRGDFTRKVTVTASDELGELAVAFNRMIDNLQHSNEELQTTIRTLQDTRAQLVQTDKLSALGEFIAGITHELNNPLGAIVGFSELLKERHGDGELKKDLETVADAAVRCQNIVQNLLSFARQHAPVRKPADLCEIIDATLNFMSYELRTSSVSVSRRYGEAKPIVMADANQLQQVFLNLINNARQAIAENGGPGNIVVTTEVANGWATVTVSDDGPGIDEANLSKVFDPFFTTKEVGVGTGLGLSVTYGIIREHDGDITVESRPDAGTTFRISLPLSHSAVQVPDEEEAVTLRGEGRRVLVVDDEKDIARLVQEILEGYGFAVETFTDSRAALDRLGEANFDLILCDWRMPDIAGQAFLETLQERKPAAAARVVFMTGDILNEQASAYMADRSIHCIAKPFSRDAFVKVVSAYFG